MIHRKYGGSTAARTLACPEWHELSRELPRPPESYSAKLGNALHDIFEQCSLDVDLEPHTCAGELRGVEVTEEIIDDKIWPALDALEQLMDDYDIKRYWCELEGVITEDIGGTADFVGLSSDEETLVVADYKSGDGVMVFADDNAQALFYAMCILTANEVLKPLRKKIKRIVVAIIQPSPRREHTLDVWETDMERVNAFAEEHHEAVTKSEAAHGKPHHKLTPVCGSHYKFCPAEAFCPAKKALVEQSRTLPVNGLEVAELAQAMSIVDDVEAWAKAVRKMTHETLEKGVHVAGYKLVDKRANRVWADPEAVEKRIRNNKSLTIGETHTRKLMSPPQIEKVCKAKGVDFKKFDDLVVSVSSGTTLVSERDKRPAVVVSEFNQLIEGRFA